ncbi:hypothetical protein GOP47_0010087 [Adiantum capillus-veneris]|uniref:Uncharacterized protein n=1 Tax=Adiantum capillus-veneris TaxID=13818 RepID=A0A9D4ZIF8_ADICA|nr:hypothetical protein GOP47_0010087 [Adiantum capillus-veneris]
MDALSSASVVTAAIAQPSSFTNQRLLCSRSLAFPSAWNTRPLLTTSNTASKGSSCHASIVLPISAAVKEVDVSKVVPQADRVLIRLEELPQQSTGGVLLPKSAVKFEHYLCGEVVSVGKEASGVTKGQKVLFSDLNAYEVNLGTKERLCFCKAGDLLAFVE